MRVFLTDKINFNGAASSRKYTDEGYLRVPGRVARTGVQKYLAKDLKITDRDPGSVVLVYRPDEEVFAPESLSSYADSDVVNDHPPEMVNSNSYRRVAVGHASGGGTRDGDFVVVDLIIKDAAAIKSIESGKSELSAGYEAEYDHSPGQTADGIEYEYIQRNIRINHVALVDRARAGPRARLFDNKPEGAMPQITLDGRTVEVADASTATLLADIFDRKNSEITKLTADMSEMEKKHDKAQAEKDAAEEELEKKKKESSDSAIASRLAEVVAVVSDAKIVAGKEFVADGVDIVAIKRAALAAVRDSIDWPKQTETYINVAFDMAKENAEKEADDEDEDEKSAKKSRDSFAADMATSTAATDAKTPANKFIDGITNGWKKTVGAE